MRIKNKQNAFTLIELLVVVAIVGILLTIAIPGGIALRNKAKIVTSRNTVNLIDNAIQMFQKDHEEYSPGIKYPDLYSPFTSYSESIVQVLTGYLDTDEKTGYGFRLETRGKVYGPYNGTEKIKTIETTNNNPVFVDSFDQPIWYCRFDDSGTNPEFTVDSTIELLDGNFKNKELDGPQVAGENGSNDEEKVYDYGIKDENNSGTDDDVLYRRDFMLLSPGQDGKWTKPSQGGDDITNFKYEE